MAAGVIYIKFSNGQVLSGYCNAEPVGNLLPITEFGDAGAATTTRRFKVLQDCVLTDVMNVDTNLTAGELEVYNFTTGKASGKFLPVLTQANILNSVENRPIPMIKFKGGHEYGFLVRTATS